MTVVATRPQPDIAGLLEANRNALLQALPKTVKIDRFLRVAMNAIARNPDLQKCTASSLYGAIMQSAQFGLEVGLMNQAHLVPYWNSEKRCFEAQFQIGYLGLRDMAEWYGDVEDGDAQVVYEKDVFDYELGDNPSITHKPSKDQSRGEPIFYYAWAKPKTGKIKVAVMSRAEVEEHRDRFVRKTKSGDFSPAWSKTFDAMGIKTVMRKCYKPVARSPQLREAIALDELREVQIPQGLGVELDQEQVETMRLSNTEKLKQLQATQESEQAKPEAQDAQAHDLSHEFQSSEKVSDDAPPAIISGSAGHGAAQLNAANVCQQFLLCEHITEWANLSNAWQDEAHMHSDEERTRVKAAADAAKKRLGKR